MTNAHIDMPRVCGESKFPNGSHLAGSYKGRFMHAKFKSVYSFYRRKYILVNWNILFYQHKRLISIFEEGEVLELYEEDRDIALIDEETGEEHEGNNQHGGKGDG